MLGILRRNLPARPTSPVPRSERDDGSGTTVIFVSPLEIVADPLKNPLPTGLSVESLLRSLLLR